MEAVSTYQTYKVNAADRKGRIRWVGETDESLFGELCLGGMKGRVTLQRSMSRASGHRESRSGAPALGDTSTGIRSAGKCMLRN